MVLICFSAASLVAQPAITMATTGPGYCSDSGYPSTGFIGGDGSTTAVSTSVADYNTPNLDGMSTCTVTVDTELDTFAPIEPGFLHVSLIGQVDESGGSSAAFMSFYVNGTLYDHCVAEGCGGLDLTIPVTLGVPFEITTVAGGWLDSMDHGQFAVGGDGFVQATIEAYASGPADLSPIFLASSSTPVTTSDTSTPEPGTWLLALPILGLWGVSCAAPNAGHMLWRLYLKHGAKRLHRTA